MFFKKNRQILRSILNLHTFAEKTVGATIQYLRTKQINRIAWDNCVENATMPFIYGHSWYLDIVSPHWEGLVWQRNGVYLAVMPLPIRVKHGYRYIHQPIFCQYLGIFSIQKLESAIVNDFFLVLQHTFGFVARYDLSPVYAEQQLAAYWQIERRINNILPLNQTYDTIVKNFRRDRKARLKQAKNKGLNSFRGHSIEALWELFTTNVAHKIVGGIHPDTYMILQNLFIETEQRGLSELLYATHNGKIVAGVWFVYHRQRIIYLFNAANQQGNLCNARTWLINQCIEQNSEKPLIFDFESPTQANVSDFYQSFGAVTEPYFCINYQSSAVNIIQKIREILKFSKRCQ